MNCEEYMSAFVKINKEDFSIVVEKTLRKINYSLQQTTFIKGAYATDENFAEAPLIYANHENFAEAPPLILNHVSHHHDHYIIIRVQRAIKTLLAERTNTEIHVPTLIQMCEWVSSLHREIQAIWKSIRNTLKYFTVVRSTLRPGDATKSIRALTQVDEGKILKNIDHHQKNSFYGALDMSFSDFNLFLPALIDAFRNDTMHIGSLLESTPFRIYHETFMRTPRSDVLPRDVAEEQALFDAVGQDAGYLMDAFPDERPYHKRRFMRTPGRLDVLPGNATQRSSEEQALLDAVGQDDLMDAFSDESDNDGAAYEQFMRTRLDHQMTAKRSYTDTDTSITEAREAMITKLTEQLYSTMPESDRPMIAECLRIIWSYFPKDVSITSLKDLGMAARNLNPASVAYQLMQHKQHRVCMTNIFKVIVGHQMNDTTAKRSYTDTSITEAREAMITKLTEQLYSTIPESDRPMIAECLRMIWSYFPKDVSITSLKDLGMAAMNLNPAYFAYQLMKNKQHRVCMTNIFKVIVGHGGGWPSNSTA